MKLRNTEWSFRNKNLLMSLAYHLDPDGRLGVPSSLR